MSHILGLSFLYHRYHRDAIVRVYADDFLVDEFNLTDDMKLKVIDRKEMPSRWSEMLNYCPITIQPEKLFLFEINEAYLKDRIRIEVVNDHNNHTNGFMTEFSFITFQHLFLIPKSLKYSTIQRLDKFSPTAHPMAITHSPTLLKDRLFPKRPTFDDIFVINSKGKWDKEFYRHKRGGSLTFEIPLFRKHNLIHLGRLLPGKISVDWEIIRTLWAFKSINMSK